MIEAEARCGFCQGVIQRHDDDAANPWKHRLPEDAFRCAKDRPQHEVAPAEGTIVLWNGVGPR